MTYVAGRVCESATEATIRRLAEIADQDMVERAVVGLRDTVILMAVLDMDCGISHRQACLLVNDGLVDAEDLTCAGGLYYRV